MVINDTDIRRIQRRVLGTLLGAQVSGSIAVSSGIAMGGLILADASGSASQAGFSQAASTLGSALVAVPAARLAFARGRRISLTATYLTAAVGAAAVVLGSALSSVILVVAGMLAFGAGQAASLQSRFAGLDLATESSRGKTLSMLLFVVTVGGVVGPNLAGPTEGWAHALGLSSYAGPFLVAIALLVASALWIQWRLRPDPLLIAMRDSAAVESAPPTKVGIRAALASLWSTTSGRAGLLAVSGAHAAMVAVMVMTPVHIDHAGHGIEVVGLIISGHVLGMYAFSPVMGIIADRYGARATVLLGAGVLLAACVVCMSAGPDAMSALAVGLFLLGVGWSACMVGGSLLVAASAEPSIRTAVQGASDLTMGLAAAAVASCSGVIVQFASYAWLAAAAAILVVPMVVALILDRRGACPSA